MSSGINPEIARRLEASTRGMTGTMDLHTIETRATLLKARLLAKTMEKHRRFMEEIGEPEFDPVKCQTWHHLFPVHEIQVEITRKLNPKPETKHCMGVAEFLQKNDVKDRLVRAALEEAAKAQAQENGETRAQTGVFSEGLMNKIRAKERAVQENKRLLCQSEKKSKRKGAGLRLVEVAETIRAIFSTQQTGKAMQRNVIEEKLRDEERGKFYSPGEVTSSVDKLLSIVPLWIRAVDTGFGCLIRIDRAVPMDTVKKMLEDAGSENAGIVGNTNAN